MTSSIRSIKQIAAIPGTVFACCEDGTAWSLGAGEKEWCRLPRIPQFAVGQVWTDREGKMGTITLISGTFIHWREYHGPLTFEIGIRPNGSCPDLVKLIKDVPGEVPQQ